MKDYIATPKLNGYRALHTVVLPIGSDQQGGGPERQGPIETEVFPLELQIRTVDMHRMAESGIAADGEVKAAWRLQAKRTARKLRKQRKAAGLDVSVDEGDSSDSDEEEEEVNPEESVMVRSGHARQVEWLSNIRQWQEEFLGVITAEEFVDTVTGDLLGRRVFVFTPSGGVMNMPHGATVVDYAFYTDAGLDMIEAKVNGVAVEFSCQLQRGRGRDHLAVCGRVRLCGRRGRVHRGGARGCGGQAEDCAADEVPGHRANPVGQVQDQKVPRGARGEARG